MSVTRRRFLAAAGVTAAGAAGAAAGLGPVERLLGVEAGRRVAGPAAAEAPRAPSGNGTLVLVGLYGGNDGLNTLVPYQDAAYHATRPALGLRPADVLPLDAELGLHRNLAGLKTLWDGGRLAIVRGVGHAEPTFSHFREMAIWQSGDPTGSATTGWLGRWLDRTAHDPLRAMSLGPTMPLVLRGETAAGAALPSGTPDIAAPLATAFRGVETRFAGEPPLAALVARSGGDLLEVLGAVKEILAAQAPDFEGTNLEGTAVTSPSAPAAKGGTVAPATAGVSSSLASQLDLVARLIKGGLPTRAYVVSAGGFDTHGNEKPTHDRLLADLDAAVTTFVNTMAAVPEGRHVVVATFSEFGRRVAENASGGTDHGSAGVLFVAGPSVRGGFYGDQPSLSDLDDGNLRTTTDFRSVYATLAGGVLGADPTDVLQGQPMPLLGFV